MRATLSTLAGAAMITLLNSCSGSPLTGPPHLHFGRDECAGCGMIINESRSSCALLVTRDGKRDHLVFDDIGCMLDCEHDGLKGATVIERYVHDMVSQLWIDTTTSTFVLADPKSLPTPMGSGIAAFSDPAGATAVQAAQGGRVLNWSELVAARRRWMEERYGKPSSPGG